MAAVSWKSAVSENWTTGADWSTGAAPAAGERPIRLVQHLLGECCKLLPPRLVIFVPSSHIGNGRHAKVFFNYSFIPLLWRKLRTRAAPRYNKHIFRHHHQFRTL